MAGKEPLPVLASGPVLRLPLLSFSSTAPNLSPSLILQGLLCALVLLSQTAWPAIPSYPAEMIPSRSKDRLLLFHAAENASAVTVNAII